MGFRARVRAILRRAACFYENDLPSSERPLAPYLRRGTGKNTVQIETCQPAAINNVASGVEERPGNARTLSYEPVKVDLLTPKRDNTASIRFADGPPIPLPARGRLFSPVGDLSAGVPEADYKRRNSALQARGSKRLQRARSQNKPLPPSPSHMSAAELLEVLDTFHSFAGGIDYVISGRTAMAVWGFADIAPVHIEVLCPAHAVQALRSWAVTKGMYLYSHHPRVIGVPTRSGNVRGVKLKVVASGGAFSRLCGVQPWSMDFPYAGTLGTTVHTKAQILSLSGLLDIAADRFVQAPEDAQRRQKVGADIIWLLKRVIDGGFVEEGGVLTPYNVPHVLSPLFWHGFTESYDHGEDAGLKLLEQAGLTTDLLHWEKSTVPLGITMSHNGSVSSWSSFRSYGSDPCASTQLLDQNNSDVSAAVFSSSDNSS